MSLFQCVDCRRRKATTKGARCPACQLRVRIREGIEWSERVAADPHYTATGYRGPKSGNAGLKDGTAYR